MAETEAPQSDEGVTRRVFTTQSHPIYYLAITKCGCTFLKNLFYLLDHGSEHEDAAFIHRHEDEIPRATHVPVDAVRDSAYGFVVVRDPVDRFLSFYFEKVYGTGPHSFPHIRRKLIAETGFDGSPGLDAAGHRQNARLLINWIARNLDDETDLASNPHWRRQTDRLRIARRLRLTMIPLDQLNTALPELLGDLIPDLPAKMAQVRARNVMPRVVRDEDLLDEGLTQRIEEVYAGDRAAYLRASAHWQGQSEAAQPVSDVIRRTGAALQLGLMHFAGFEQRRQIMGAEITAGAPDPAVPVHTVIRHPVARLLSAYEDCLLESGPHGGLRWLAGRLQKLRGFVPDPGDDPDQHRRNLDALLEHVDYRLRTKGDTALSPRLRPQAGYIAGWIGGEARVLRYDHFASDARALGLDLPGDGLPAAGPVAQALAESDAVARIEDLYADDLALYRTVSDHWQRTGTAPHAQDLAPWRDAREATRSQAG